MTFGRKNTKLCESQCAYVMSTRLLTQQNHLHALNYCVLFSDFSVWLFLHIFLIFVVKCDFSNRIVWKIRVALLIAISQELVDIAFIWQTCCAICLHNLSLDPPAQWFPHFAFRIKVLKRNLNCYMIFKLVLEWIIVSTLHVLVNIRTCWTPFNEVDLCSDSYRADENEKYANARRNNYLKSKTVFQWLEWHYAFGL